MKTSAIITANFRFMVSQWLLQISISWDSDETEMLMVQLVTKISSNENINSLWPSDTIWHHKSGSTLAQVMACCLRAPSHYLNQCWLIISKVQWHSSECNFTRDASAISHWNLLENYLSEFCSNLPWANELNILGLNRQQTIIYSNADSVHWCRNNIIYLGQDKVLERSCLMYLYSYMQQILFRFLLFFHHIQSFV